MKWCSSDLSLATDVRLVTCSTTFGPEVKLNLLLLYGPQRSILDSFLGGRGELTEALKLIGERRLKAVIDSAFPLQDAAQAQANIRERCGENRLMLAWVYPESKPRPSDLATFTRWLDSGRERSR
ncbi:MAG: hypothetical protein LAO07_03210 [Acidobacteriia bacterium]|nr:hypothetical protein [Terriglobia bacterium]